MTAFRWTDRDLQTLAARGIPPEELDRQVDLFRNPPAPARLDRPCVPGDGVRQLSAEDHPRLLAAWEKASNAGRIARFVPASGAATRMFKSLAAALATGSLDSVEELRRRAEDGESEARDVLRLADHVGEFACGPALAEVLERRGIGREEIAAGRHLKELLEALLTPEGLDSLNLPKGLLEFHRYPDGSRTPFEEHLVEAALTARDRNGDCRLHFTVSPEHEAGFRALLDRVRGAYESALETRFLVEFSFQDPSTDTLAVDLEGAPFRDPDGSLVFRPGGHGALIRNLQRMSGDLVLIKNIDNVVPDRLKSETVLWKRLLAGLLAEIQERCFSILRRLEAGEDEAAVEDGLELLEETFHDQELAALRRRPLPERADRLRSRLHRPLRVCGVVRNEGEPGGGPFWVEGADGVPTPQIVEGSQVDHGHQGQAAIWKSSTHFNPVDLACGLLDHHGRPHDLEAFIDPAAVFISRKSREGRELRALERPGLWNGAMARWNTLFVEVPIATFAPVKTIFDLLRPQHRGVDPTSLPDLRIPRG